MFPVKHFKKESKLKIYFPKKEEKKFFLSKEHNKKGQEICKKHITKRYLKKGCKRCGLSGTIGNNDENFVIACNCVDEYNALAEWLKYCEDYPELKEKCKQELIIKDMKRNY